MSNSEGFTQQSARPEPAAAPTAIAAPRDIPYAGTIRLTVDATDIDRHIFIVRESIPVRGGDSLVLFYPQWLPGNHSPTGRIDKLAGLTIRANGMPVEWRRDTVNVFAFHVAVPANVTALDAEFQYLSPVDTDEGRIVMTPEMLNLQWNAVVLYPAGYFTRQIMVEPSVRLPDNWQFATALETAPSNGGLTNFKRVPLETLVDSPIFAGRYFKRVDLEASGGAPVHLDIVADRADLLEMKPEQLAAHRGLVEQANKLFGSHHYDHYDLLLALTNRMGGIGLEHHQSSENGTAATYFTEWEKNVDRRDLLPHEYTHSWNGKFRRPADLWTPNFNTPMRDSLLWMYEGQTEYWGFVLAARSGLWTRQQALDAIAATAAVYDHRAGREWRSLEDTTNDPIMALRRPLPWRSWQRSEDYYLEGQLVWLDADTLIRELSHGARSLDDFARAFFGINDGSYIPVTYTFDDVVNALNRVQPHDWSKFLRARLDGHGPGAPLDGLNRGGYKLVYKETPSEYFKNEEERRKISDLTYSLGMIIGNEGKLTEVLWEGLAYQKGLTVGTQIIAVDGIAYNIDRLKAAIKEAQKAGTSIELLVKNGDHYRTVRMDYHDGLRYPHLERTGAVAFLDQILAPR
ncbi:MAG: peptidase M61 [Acidobacteria bacterium 13_1_40CM_56_16]|nr:MAG: peptidase M61 [Acidobacteria bacterium 13_1_40CM_56_16]